ncbi:MAG: hypothetical protein R3E53_09860 [Myxococcota bacterium]
MTTLGDGDPGLDSAVVISDDNTVTLGPDATISVTDPGGFGLRGGDRNTISLDGALDVSAAATGATGIAVGNDNDVTLGLDAIVTLDADDAIGVLAGNDNIVQNLGRIVVNGDDGRPSRSAAIRDCPFRTARAPRARSCSTACAATASSRTTTPAS